MEKAACCSSVSFHDLIVRPARCDERARWRELMQAHHYLGFQRIVGQSLWYVATLADQWVALLGWGAAALKCAPRDAWIGWTPSLKFRRLHLIANNVRFLILPAWHVPNLASRILALNLNRLSPDWERYYGHPLLLAETFVDGARFRGTCYRAAGWQVLGTTRGFAKRGRGYVAHGQSKLVLVRPLRPGARLSLRAAFLPPATLQRKENTLMVDVNRLPLEGEGGLIDLLRTLDDPRHRRGVRHPLVTVVAIAVCAALSGARGFQAVAEWGKDLSRDTLQRLGSKRWTAPSEPTIRRVLSKLDAEIWDAHIGQWLLQHCDLKGQAVSVDGKTLRRAHDAGQPAPHLLSALLHQEGVVVAQRAVGDKTNEIPELPRLLEALPLAGAVVTADALHTQNDTARYVVEAKKADYLFTVKDNQPTLKQDIADLHLEAFPPSAHGNR
ncbi:MAG TPA: ISAs1 family transposase [Terriglobales bacterium]|nr:ISAs1 family transposase [Terriglobales bacterium]